NRSRPARPVGFEALQRSNPVIFRPSDQESLVVRENCCQTISLPPPSSIHRSFAPPPPVPIATCFHQAFHDETIYKRP
ncbi:hypothetical protein MCOR14_010181, partial [Pyricularia oryzae]